MLSDSAMHTLYELDLKLCLSCNRISGWHPLAQMFRAVSRLGDGPLWYALMLLFPLLYPERGWLISAHMLAAAVPALLIYRFLKHRTLRPRPCAVSPQVAQQTRALDEFSFPSEHTLHAVCLTLVIAGRLPASAWLLGPLSSLIALSRPVLGLHYPSDVLAGAVLAAAVAAASGWLPFFN